MKISEQKVRVETPYGVKIFQKFHFQKHAPIMEKRLAKKKFQKDQLQKYIYDSRLFILFLASLFWFPWWTNEELEHWYEIADGFDGLK